MLRSVVVVVLKPVEVAVLLLVNVSLEIRMMVVLHKNSEHKSGEIYHWEGG